MGKLQDRVFKRIQDRKKNAEEGRVNCIPFPFPRFRSDIPGIEQAKFYIVTGATKSAKTQFSSFLFLYHPLLYAYEHPDHVSVKIIYYNQEETEDQIFMKFISYVLYTKSDGKYRISPVDLMSTNVDKPLNNALSDILHNDEYQKLYDFFESHVMFYSGANPTGVLKDCRRFAEDNGVVHKKKMLSKDEFNNPVEKEVFDYYESNNPNEYRIIIYDHASLVKTEGSKSLRDSMQDLSSNLLHLRNNYGFTAVLVQQQTMFETLDAYKMDMLKPSIANLADNKATSRDCDMCISMFSPYKYSIPAYKVGSNIYDITKLKDNVRFMECLINRQGQSNGVLPLYFDGACGYFEELPVPNTPEMDAIYGKISGIRQNTTGILFYNYSKLINNNGNHITKNQERSEQLQSEDVDPLWEAEER